MHAYIPQDVWYEFPSGIEVKVVGVFTDLDAPLDKINVHVRGSFIIPMQIPGPNLMTGRGNPFTLLVAQSASGNATGNLFWDDGDSIGEYIFGNNINHTYFFRLIKIRSKQKPITTWNFHLLRRVKLLKEKLYIKCSLLNRTH